MCVQGGPFPGTAVTKGGSDAPFVYEVDPEWAILIQTLDGGGRPPPKSLPRKLGQSAAASPHSRSATRLKSIYQLLPEVALCVTLLCTCQFLRSERDTTCPTPCPAPAWMAQEDTAHRRIKLRTICKTFPLPKRVTHDHVNPLSIVATTLATRDGNTLPNPARHRTLILCLHYAVDRLDTTAWQGRGPLLVCSRVLRYRYTCSTVQREHTLPSPTIARRCSSPVPSAARGRKDAAQPLQAPLEPGPWCPPM